MSSTSKTIRTGPPEEIPEYRVRRVEDGPWETATEQEAAEFRAHDESMAAEAEAQEARSAENYQQFAASMAQQWDDWAMLNWIHIASNNHDQTAMVTFQVTETLLGGITEEPSMELGPQAVAANASPQLADFDPEYLPGLSGATVAFMKTQEARHWVYRFMEGLATDAMIQNRFGAEVAEIFHMWVAVRDNVDMEVRNCLAAGGDLAPVASAVGEEAAAESDKSTVMVDGDGGLHASQMHTGVSHIMPEGEAGATREDDGSEGSSAASHAENMERCPGADCAGTNGVAAGAEIAGGVVRDAAGPRYRRRKGLSST